MEFAREYILEFALKFVWLKKYITKIMVSRNLPQTHLLEVGLTEIPRHHETVSIIRHGGLHVDFPSMKFSLGL